MDRGQMIERVVDVMLSEYIEEDLTPRAWDYMLAEKVLDAILPQVATVEELKALPVGSLLIDDEGNLYAFRHDHLTPIRRALPLTVVWRP